MESQAPEGPPPWRIAVAFGILGMLALGVCAVSRRPSLPAAGPNPSTSVAATGVAPTTATAPTVTEGPSTTARPTLETTSTLGELDPALLPGDVFAHTQAALAAWGEFAATGELAVIEATFVIDGPQYGQLAEEAQTLVDDGGGPFEFLLTFPQVVDSEGGERATVRATVVIVRNGDQMSEVAWDIEMRWFPGEGRWRLFKASDSS